MLKRRIGPDKTAQFVDAILTSQLYRILRIDERLWKQAWELFKAYGDQAFSFTDCTSFALMKADGVQTAFAFDEHFRIAGFHMVP